MEGLLPEAVTTVAKADLEPFANGKRVGSYLFGRTIGEGSFAKVKEALHVSTGEKVPYFVFFLFCVLPEFYRGFPCN